MPTVDLLRRHVGRRADRGSGGGQIGIFFDRAGDSEIGQQRSAGDLVEEDVLRFDITMDHAATMRVGERAGDVAQHVFGFVRRHGASGQGRLEGHAGHELHHERQSVVQSLDRVQRHNVRMLELRHRTRLARETGDGFLVGVKARTHDLDGHVATERMLTRTIDNGHAAASELSTARVFCIKLVRPSTAAGSASVQRNGLGHVVRPAKRPGRRRPRVASASVRAPSLIACGTGRPGLPSRRDRHRQVEWNYRRPSAGD